MKVLSNIDLYKFSTMRLHSIGTIVHIPEKIEELCNIIKEFKYKNEDFHIVSNGSNIVFAERVTTPLIVLTELDKSIEKLPDGNVKVGTSVKMMKLLNNLKEWNLGGIEYLASVPTTVGGAVYMNAGRGKKIGLSISDYLISVDYLDIKNGVVKTFKGTEGFSYRHSPFQDFESIILSATFKFKGQDKTETDRLIKERLDYSKKYLSADKPSCGSVFCKMNPILIRLLRGLKKGGAMYSRKTPNWITNAGNATASDVVWLMEFAKKLHKLFFCRIQQEIRVFH